MTQLRAGWLSVAACSGMFGFGIVMALLGAILPLYVDRLKLNLSNAGGLFLAMNAAMLVTTLVLGPVLDRFGIRSTMLIAPLVVAAAVALIAVAQSACSLTFEVVLLGAGGGALNQAANTLIADLHEDARKKNAALNILGVFFGFGALFIPFTIGSLLPSLGVRKILYAAALLSLVPLVISAVLRFPGPAQAGPVHKSAVRQTEFFRLLREPLVLAFAFLLFFESGNEFILGGFLSTYLTHELRASLSLASYALAGYWGALMLARLVLGRVLLTINGEGLIRWSALSTAFCLLLLSFIRSPAAGAVVAVLLGADIAAIFPTVLGLAGARYPRHSGTVFGILIGIALLGGMTLPWLTGHIAAAHSLSAALWLPAAAALAIFVLQLVTQNLAKREALK